MSEILKCLNESLSKITHNRYSCKESKESQNVYVMSCDNIEIGTYSIVFVHDLIFQTNLSMDKIAQEILYMNMLK